MSCRLQTQHHSSSNGTKLRRKGVRYFLLYFPVLSFLIFLPHNTQQENIETLFILIRQTKPNTLDYPVTTMSTTSQSNVGGPQIYEAGDQRVPPDSQKPENQAHPYNEGKPHSHNNNDSKDQRSIANRLAASGPQNETSGSVHEKKANEIDPTLPARQHGNEPSRGAQIDKEIQDEEAEILKKKDAASGGAGKGGTGDVAGKKN
ncbi:hypothetical protein ABEF92_008169 [Exophiala dermatitidis]